MNITAKTTKPQLLAYIAALEARVAAHVDSEAKLRRELKELEAAGVTQSDITIVETRGALLAQLKYLAKSGVPCRMQGNVIKHSKTQAVIAQVRA